MHNSIFQHSLPIIFCVTLTAENYSFNIIYHPAYDVWLLNLWRHYQTHKQFDLDEQKEIAYMVGEVCYLIFKMILMIRNKTTTWLDVEESFLY